MSVQHATGRSAGGSIQITMGGGADSAAPSGPRPINILASTARGIAAAAISACLGATLVAGTPGGAPGTTPADDTSNASGSVAAKPSTTVAEPPARSTTAKVVITEVMYNPASDEANGETEWVEIANLGDSVAELVDWKLDDEDTKSNEQWSTFSCSLKPGEVAVLVNVAAVTESTFREAWDSSDAPANYTIIPVKWGGLANSPSATNEVLRLLEANGAVVCEVNLENGGAWPKVSVAGGPSIVLAAPRASDATDPAALNDGARWTLSRKGESGAVECRQIAPFNGRDIGSPGRLPAPVASASAPAKGNSASTAPSNAPSSNPSLNHVSNPSPALGASTPR